MKKIYLTLLFSLSLSAQMLQESIEYSIAHNYQIQILEEERAISSEQSKIESFWDDPTLQVGINDIQGDKPFSRNEEPMQNQYATYSQKIPLSKRLKVSSALESKKGDVYALQQEALKVNIAYEVRKAFISANNATKTLKILDDYIAFLKTPLQLYINLSAVERGSVEGYIKTQLLQKNYQLQRQNALQRIQIAKEQIELVGNLKMDTFDDEVSLKHYEHYSLEELLLKVKEKSPELEVAMALKEVAQKGVELAREKEQADITVTGGVYQRFDRNDYVSFAVSYPLYTHGKQERERVQAMKRVNIQELNYKKRAVQLAQGLKIERHELQALQSELKLLKESRSKIDKLIANAKAELSTGGSLVHYYELFTQKSNNKLEQNQKEFQILNVENEITQLLGEI